MSNGIKNLILKYFVEQFSSDIPRDENILPWAIFTQKYPMANFSQTMVYINNNRKRIVIKSRFSLSTWSVKSLLYSCFGFSYFLFTYRSTDCPFL